MELQSGHDHYKALKFAPELSEFSWGFNILRYDYEKNEDDWRIMNIYETKIFEVSPVLVGAGVNTGVLEMKSRHGRVDAAAECLNSHLPQLEEETLLYHPSLIRLREERRARTLKEV